KWSKKDARFVKAFFTRNKFYYFGDLTEWLDRQYFYDARPASSRKRASARRAYRIVFGKPFEPETFDHHSLSPSPELMRNLTHVFGSREGLKEYIEKGGALDLGSAYAAALFGFLPMERVQDYWRPKDRRRRR
ncbi:MAG TPA: hypothetical protein VMT80_01890, partial [Candidatus Paceibacterota bacterium]|nr:hypothetical protein [Candidatus Paceibacterota bacterium]